MDIYMASDGGVVKIPHSLSDYDSLEGVYADVSAVTGIVAGNVLLFTEDGRELRQEVLEELWERGGHAGSSMSRSQAVYLFNRETFFSEPDRWANELREDVVLPPPLDLSAPSQSFEVAYDHLLHLQSLFSAQARALRIAYANLTFHLEPILEAFREFAGRADGQLDHHEKLLQGYEVDMAMLPKVVVHESLFRRRDKDGEEKKKTLVDWIHSKKMEQVRDWCQTAHTDYISRYNGVASEMDELALQSESDKQAADERILTVESEFVSTLGGIEGALGKIEELMRIHSVDLEPTIVKLDQAMREDLATITQVKNDFTRDLHTHLRNIATLQVRITKFTRPMTELDLDLRQKNAFPHLERLHNLPFAYAANVIEIVHRKEFATSLVEWTGRFGKAVNEFLALEAKRRQQHKVDNHLPWEIPALEESKAPRVDITVGGGNDALAAVVLGRNDIDDLFKWVKDLQEDPDFMAVDPGQNPVGPLTSQMTVLVGTLQSLTGELEHAVGHALRYAEGVDGQPRANNAEYESRLAEMEEQHQAKLLEMEERYEQRVSMLQSRQGELQEELVRLRSDLADESLARQQLATELEDKTRESEERARELDEQHDFIVTLQADMSQEKDRATDLGVRLQEALLDVDGLRSAEQTLVYQVRDMQEERTRILTDLGEAQLIAQNYESELAGTKAELQATGAQLLQAQQDRDQALKSQSAEAERLMRDRIAEADGDRAVLEHQNLTLTKDLEDARTAITEQLAAAKNAAIRREDGLKAELSFTKAQLREVQRRETVLADEVATAKDVSSALANKETHHTELAKDAVVLAGKYHDACQRLMGAIAASTTISGSLSIPARGKTPPLASPSNADLKDSTVLGRSLETASAFELDSFTDAVLRTINLARKLSKSCKQYRELSRNKITISNFGKGDLVLFLPTRNAAVKAWAAFNISAPHHFLHVTDTIQQQLVGKDYYLARIVGTEEAVVNGDSPETNPYGLAEGLRYYSHHVEEWTPGLSRTARRSISAAANPGDSPVSTPAPVRGRTQSGSYTTATHMNRQDSTQSAPPPSPPPGVSPPAMTPMQRISSVRIGTSPVPRDSTASPGIGSPSRRTTSPGPIRGNATSPVPARANTFHRANASSPVPTRGSPSPVQRLQARSPVPSPLPTRPMSAKSPPPPPASPTSPINVRTVPPGSGHRSNRASLSSTASIREGFAPSSLGRPSSIASSASSHPRGLAIPAPSGKAAPAAPVATSGDSSGTGSLSDRRVSKKSSAASLKKSDDLFKPSPLGSEANNGNTGFLSGLSLTRKRHSSVTAPTALDILKRFEGGS